MFKLRLDRQKAVHFF